MRSQHGAWPLPADTDAPLASGFRQFKSARDIDPLPNDLLGCTPSGPHRHIYKMHPFFFLVEMALKGMQISVLLSFRK